MRGLFSSLTTRGRSFMAAGGAAMVCGLAIPEPDLVRVGALLVILPAVSALIARRSRYRLSCARRLDPPRIPAGQPTTVTARVENVSRLRTGVLLAEDVTPYTLGSRPRFVLDEIEPGGHRELSYQIRSDSRGKFTIGPLRVRVADAFGLVEISRSFSTTQHARGHAQDLPAAAGHRAEQLARRGRRRDADDLGRRRGRRGSAGRTRTETACTGCTGGRRRGTAS